MTLVQDLIEISERFEVDQFLKKAKRLAAEDYNRSVHERKYYITSEQVYIVWFAKVLQNWKALVSTDAHPGLYWEITYNGEKKETYVDLYSKTSNRVVPDVR